MRFFSDKNRPVHLGPYPLERLARESAGVDFRQVAKFRQLSFDRPEDPISIVNAMAEYQAMMDTVRDGLVAPNVSGVPGELTARSNHLKAFGYFSDASMMGIGALPDLARLGTPYTNPDIARLSEALRTRQTKTLASGIDLIMADLKESMEAPPTSIDNQTRVIVILNEAPRPPRGGEPGTEWLSDCTEHVAALRASEAASVLANYLRVLGFEAKAHSATSSDIDLNIATVAAGLAAPDGSELWVPFLKNGFGVAAVTTNMELTTDRPLKRRQEQSPWRLNGPAWLTGKGTRKGALNLDPFAKRRFADGPHPFETLKRVDEPTTYIDEPNVARVPKRTDMFARAQFGDMGEKIQSAAKGGYYVRKAAPSMAQRRLLGAFVLLQDGPVEAEVPVQMSPSTAAANVKAASYFLGIDAVGLSRCPEWAWYSHDATGVPIVPPHDQAVSMIVDQGFETMEGASGDDWISVAQSMRAYLRFSLLGGVIAKQLRRLGYKAKAHTVMDGEVLQPPLLLLSGLGEVSRIGEVILNPFLGPRLKSGVITTDLPMLHDKPIDFGLQSFCEACNKCARECPSGAITAGPKLMFNGYEIWKSDSQKCATYRITTEGGAMCGRCMKTCPWNLEGLFAEKPFRWAAMTFPAAAKSLAKLDDTLGRGSLNPVKKWWWDLELQPNGAYQKTEKPLNERGLQTDLDLKYEDQTLAVYPADLAPHPYPYPFPMDREAGIQAYRRLITAAEYRAKSAQGETDHLHIYTNDIAPPVVQVQLSKVQPLSAEITKYEFQSLDGSELPEWTAGAHLDVVVAPEYLRQYSMSGNPEDRSKYQIAVLREEHGRGGSALMHRIFTEGRKVFISEPINHFPLVEDSSISYLMGGGIGITPMVAMAHRLHALNMPFELHYSVSSRSAAAFLADIEGFAWRDRLHLHISDEGTRAELGDLFRKAQPGCNVYACGPDNFMAGVVTAAIEAGIPEDSCHVEYFSPPEVPKYENYPFTLRLAKSGRDIAVSADQTATEALADAGIHVSVKCSDGICGVCSCGIVSGEVEHRDFVLSNKERETKIILCQSRAAKKDGLIEIDL
ncbi:MAG: 2Fe-2S iron-sulfur cluster-binding protein [Boseongicola sp.]|nr:2Fe-2S iron-sulfur cluster-binding protein [Boseongicola sp.]